MRVAPWVVALSWVGVALFVVGTTLPHTRWRVDTTLVRLDVSIPVAINEALLPWGMAAMAAAGAWFAGRRRGLGSGMLLGAGLLLAAARVSSLVYFWAFIDAPPGFAPASPRIGGILEIAGIAGIVTAGIWALRGAEPRRVAVPRLPVLVAVAGIAAIAAGFFLPYQAPGRPVAPQAFVITRFGLAHYQAAAPLAILTVVLICSSIAPIAALRGRTDRRGLGLALAAATFTILLFASAAWRTAAIRWSVEPGAWVAIGGGIAVGAWALFALRSAPAPEPRPVVTQN